jgi:antimicrobial peptide system SdpA family protein
VSRDDLRLDRRRGAFTASMIACLAVFSAYSVHAAMPTNPIVLPLEERLQVRAWAPQGWNFFTRNAREDRTLVFSHDAKGWSNVMSRNADAKNRFGIDRKGRAQGAELGILLGAIPKDRWTACSVSPTACLSDAEGAFRLRNTSPSPTMCGTIGIVMQPPVPWAWSTAAERVTMPSKVVRLEVQC